MRAIEPAPSRDPFSLMFKNISFKTLSQICRPIWLICDIISCKWYNSYFTEKKKPVYRAGVRGAQARHAALPKASAHH